MNDILTAMALLSPITVGLTEVVKRGIPANIDRWAPAVSLATGVGAAFLFPPAMVPMNEIAAGILSGLAASGLYSATKTTVMGR